jgi:uncharacterized protein YndB with AHSA1/START domain
MDLCATFPRPVQEVFGHLADPFRLSDWLPDVSAAGPGPPGDTKDDFSLTASLTALADGIEVAASGEVTAFEPPRLVGYRLFIGSRVHGIRVTCTAQPDGTRIQVHQPDAAAPLTIDLDRLTRAVLAGQSHKPASNHAKRSEGKEGHAPERQENGPSLRSGYHGRNRCEGR